MSEERLDIYLVKNKLVSSRVRAEKIIQEHGVLVNGKLINKPGKKIPLDSEVTLLEEEIPWVSRGALKLLKAIENWNIDFSDKIVLDVGASTGGFTEVALKHGAHKVFAVDVGQNQLHASLILNPKIVNLEKTHVRELNHNIIDSEIDICVIDVSFISLAKILPFIHVFLKKEGQVIALLKPQFEVGKENLNKKGVVSNASLYPKLLEEFKIHAQQNNLIFTDFCESPILGGDGNKEFLLFLQKK